MEKTLETHARRLAALEKHMLEQGGGIVGELAALANSVQTNSREQQAAMTKVTQTFAAQVEALARLQEGDRHLRRMQETLNQNLATLAGAGAFEEAIHSLTAAIHLLTARAGVATGGPPARTAA